MTQKTAAAPEPPGSDQAKKKKPNPDFVVAKEIGKKLGETEIGPIRQISVLVRHYGADYARALLAETLAVEKQGGMLVNNGQRRRTPGGVYFHLAKSRMTPEERQLLLPSQYARIKAIKERERLHPGEALPPFDWGARQAALAPLLAQQGAVDTVKITLIGRPGAVETFDDLVVTAMSHSAGAPTLPRGVPPLPETPTVYTVYIAGKHWLKVQESITTDPDDALVIEGLCAYDAAISGIAVYAMSVTTKKLEAAKRQTQKAGDATAPAPPAKKKTHEHPAPPTPPAEVTLPPVLAQMTPDDAQKLRELYASAALFRQKIAAIEAKPEGQRFGLEMTSKLLHNLEADITALEGKYKES
jgi:hypothetical protein